jgi:hypothetical protein
MPADVRVVAEAPLRHGHAARDAYGEQPLRHDGGGTYAACAVFAAWDETLHRTDDHAHEQLVQRETAQLVKLFLDNLQKCLPGPMIPPTRRDDVATTA